MRPNKKSPFVEVGANQRKITKYFNRVDLKIAGTSSVPGQPGSKSERPFSQVSTGKNPAASLAIADQDVIILSSDSDKDDELKSKDKPKDKGDTANKKVTARRQQRAKSRSKAKNSKKKKGLLSDSDTDTGLDSTTDDEGVTSDFELMLRNTPPTTATKKKYVTKTTKKVKDATSKKRVLTKANKDKTGTVVPNSVASKISVDEAPNDLKPTTKPVEKTELGVTLTSSIEVENNDSDSSDSVSLLAYEKSPIPVFDLENSTECEDGPGIPEEETQRLSSLGQNLANTDSADYPKIPKSVEGSLKKPATELNSTLFRIPRPVSHAAGLDDARILNLTEDEVMNSDEEVTQAFCPARSIQTDHFENEETQVIQPTSTDLQNVNANIFSCSVPRIYVFKNHTSSDETQQVVAPIADAVEKDQTLAETQVYSPGLLDTEEEDELLGKLSEEDLIAAGGQSTSAQNHIMLSPGTSPSLPRKSPGKSPRTKSCYFSPVRHVRDLSKPFSYSTLSPATTRNGDSSPSTSSKFRSPQTRSSSQSTTSASVKSPGIINWTPGGGPYYLENFRMILNSVVEEQRNSHLLSFEDMKMIHAFNELSHPSQCLYVRLFQRKWQWKPAASIKYPKIAEDLGPGFKELHSQKFLIEIKEDTPDLSSLLDLLSGDEMTTLGKKMSLNPPTKTKEGYKAALLKMVKSQRTLSGSSVDIITNAALRQLGATYQVSELSRSLFCRIFILYAPPQYWDDERNQGSNQLLSLLLINTGKMQYPEYSISRSTNIYPCRADLLRFQESWTYHSEIQGQLETKTWNDAKEVLHLALHKLKSEIFSADDDSIRASDQRLPPFLRAYTAGSVLTHTVWLGIDGFQKTKDFAASNEIIAFLLSQKIYLTQYRGRWHERFILNSKHLKQTNRELRKHIKAGLEDEYLQEAHRLDLSMRLERVKTDEPPAKAKNKSRSKPTDKRTARSTRSSARSRIESSDSDEDETEYNGDVFDPAEFTTCALKYELPERTIEGQKMSVVSERTHGKSVFLGGGSASTLGGNTLSSVELFALNCYEKEGYHQGLHAEGVVPITLYGLIFWNIIYDDSITDVFHSPFQPFPLDIHFEEFYAQRQISIEKILCDMRSKWSLNDCFSVIERNWHKHHEKISIVNWAAFESVEQVKELVGSMGLRLVAGICERLAKNFRYFRSGFPDLVVWNGRDCLFSEVKGPGDTLSSKQRLWLDYLISLGARAEVCRVKSVSNKRIRIN